MRPSDSNPFWDVLISGAVPIGILMLAVVSTILFLRMMRWLIQLNNVSVDGKESTAGQKQAELERIVTEFKEMRSSDSVSFAQAAAPVSSVKPIENFEPILESGEGTNQPFSPWNLLIFVVLSFSIIHSLGVILSIGFYVNIAEIPSGQIGWIIIDCLLVIMAIPGIRSSQFEEIDVAIIIILTILFTLFQAYVALLIVSQLPDRSVIRLVQVLGFSMHRVFLYTMAIFGVFTWYKNGGFVKFFGM